MLKLLLSYLTKRSVCSHVIHHLSGIITDVNVEHCQAMLALLYTLSDDNKKQVFTYLCKTLMTALDNPASQLVAMIPLPITRLCLILEYMMCHLSSAPDELLQQVGRP